MSQNCPPGRRNRTRQRERLLEVLQASRDHPTTAELHETLRADFPQLSLGTVYRNLEILVSEGLIGRLPSTQSAMRYDGNPAHHHHFTCESCGNILDVELPLPQDFESRLKRRYRLRPKSIRIDFHGCCSGCADRDGRSEPGRARHTREHLERDS